MTKLSFTTMGTPELDAEQAIKAAREYGYDGIDLRVSDHKGELTIDSSDAELCEIRNILDGEGIQLAGLLCYNEVGNEDENSWDAMQESLVRHLELGKKIGSPNIRMFGGNPHKDVPADEFIQRSADSIAAALVAFPEDINIVLQNHGGSYTALEGVDLIQRVDNPRFGLVFSPDHCMMMGEDMNEVYQQVPSVSKQLYLSDVIPNEETEGRSFFGILPGKGIVPFKDAYQAIGGKEFPGFVSFKWEKIWQDQLEEPEVALPYFIKFWESLQQEL